ncbi:MAG TPA: hypothetical protein VF609_08315 [Flavisolibacter sp.]
MKAKLILLLSLLSFLASSAQKEVLTNKSVLDLHKAGLTNETIISKIQSSTCKFDMSTTGLIQLKKQKLSDEVIHAMVEKRNDNEIKTPEGTGAKKNSSEPASLGIKSTQIPDLEFINVPHYYIKEKKALSVLERSTVSVKAKVNFLKAMIPGSSTPIVFKMDSAKSPVRLPEQESVSFMINTGNNVPEIFGLYKMKSEKKKREATWFNVSAFENNSDKDVIAFNYKKVKDGVYEVIPVSKLEKGEYCFVNKASYGTYGGAKADVFAFGVE